MGAAGRGQWRAGQRAGFASRRMLRAVVCCALAAALVRGAVASSVRTSSMKSAARGMQREVGEENIGFRMLRKMGWQSGAIGQSQDGLVEPIDPLANPNARTSPRKSGLGTSDNGFGGATWRQRRAADRDISYPSDFVDPAALRSRQKKKLAAAELQRKRALEKRRRKRAASAKGTTTLERGSGGDGGTAGELRRGGGLERKRCDTGRVKGGWKGGGGGRWQTIQRALDKRRERGSKGGKEGGEQRWPSA
jgi:hypothetical protein